MREALVQSLQNLRANKLRSFLTMFGILWGMISVIVLSAMGEGFQQGNVKVLRELGKNIGIVWGGRTSRQAGGERAGRRVLTLDDARALAAESPMVAVASPELQRDGVRAKSAYNAAKRRHQRHRAPVSGHPHDRLESGATSTGRDEEARVPRRHRRVRRRPAAVRTPTNLGGSRHLQRRPVHGGRQDPQEGTGQQLQRTRQQQDLRAVRGDGERHAAAGCRAGRGVQHHRVAEGLGRRGPARALDTRTRRIEDIDWPLEQNVRAVLAAATASIPATGTRSPCGTRRCETLMFERMIGHMQTSSRVVGIVTLMLGGIG